MTIMTYKEFTSQFKAQTEVLNYEKQVELAILICRRLFPDYQKFCAENDWGNPVLVRDAIEFIDGSKGLGTETAVLTMKIDQIVEITPDTEDFGDASYALNCCAAVCETLEFLIDRKASHIYNIGTCLTDTIDFKIQEDDELTETEIDNNSEMVEARNFLIEMSR